MEKKRTYEKTTIKSLPALSFNSVVGGATLCCIGTAAGFALGTADLGRLN
jgi:hypothetical protein